jgi:hypothetical protein
MKLPVTLALLCALGGTACAQAVGKTEGSDLGLAAGGLRSSDLKGVAINPALQAQALTVRTTAADDRDTSW